MTLTVDIQKELDHFTLHTSFSCPPGELAAIVGPSGSGKTTLIRLIAGLDVPDQGVVSLNGTVWTDMENGVFMPIHKRKIGLVFQEFTLFPHLTLRRNIGFGAPDDTEIDFLMDAFGILHLANKRPGGISGGERQRAACCQALARKPGLLLLDEPFSALDVATRAFLCGMLGDLKKELRIPILHVTHDLSEATRLGDEIIAVEHGQIAPDWVQRQAVPHTAFSPLESSKYS